MAATPTYCEEKCLNVYWKVQNFSFWWKYIISPAFLLSNRKHILYLISNSEHLTCYCHHLGYNACGSETILALSNCQIAILTCDGSPEEFASKQPSGYGLKVPKDIIFKTRRSAFIPNNTLTIRCRIPTDSERGNLFLRSKIEVKHANFLWTLKDFTKTPCTLQKIIEKSSHFGDIILSLKTSHGTNTDFEQMHIDISRKGGESCYCVYRFSVLDIHGNLINYGNGELVFGSNNSQTWSFPSVFKKSKLLAFKDQLLPNDTLSLRCDFAFSLGTVSDKDCVHSFYENVEVPYEDPEDIWTALKKDKHSNSTTDLQTDLKSVLDDGTLCDASLQVGTEVIRVHKTILSARSPVFKSMFATDMKEAIESAVVVSDLDVGAVRQLLVYMYTNIVQDEQWDSISRLYVAADKYQVLGLKQKCASFLKANLSVSNVCEALVLADLHRDESMKKGVLDFIRENDSEILASAEWAEVEKNHSFLAIQVLRGIWSNERLRLN